MSVSNEDAAIEQACRILHDAHTGRITPDPKDPTNYRAMAAALLAHGWGPRPTVTAEDLTEMIRQARETGALYAYLGLVNLLRECGIEVTGE